MCPFLHGTLYIELSVPYTCIFESIHYLCSDKIYDDFYTQI